MKRCDVRDAAVIPVWTPLLLFALVEAHPTSRIKAWDASCLRWLRRTQPLDQGMGFLLAKSASCSDISNSRAASFSSDMDLI